MKTKMNSLKMYCVCRIKSHFESNHKFTSLNINETVI